MTEPSEAAARTAHLIALDYLSPTNEDVRPFLERDIALAIDAAVAAERAQNAEARRQLAEAAYSIPMAGPLPDRIRALKEQHREALATEHTRGENLAEALRRISRENPEFRLHATNCPKYQLGPNNTPKCTCELSGVHEFLEEAQHDHTT